MSGILKQPAVPRSLASRDGSDEVYAFVGGGHALPANGRCQLPVWVNLPDRCHWPAEMAAHARKPLVDLRALALTPDQVLGPWLPVQSLIVSG